VPDNKAIPAVEYLMSKNGGEVMRFILEGTDYVYPPKQQDHSRLSELQGRER